jgi:phosphoribosylaminoimidazole-succinocarboxamide synthase
MPSVKEVLVDEEPDEGLGRGRFRFTDAYSVFDWGEMPDAVPDKGAALCTMGAFNFTLLEINEVPTHYRGVVTDGEVGSLVETQSPPTEMAVAENLTNVGRVATAEGRRVDAAALPLPIGEGDAAPARIAARVTDASGRPARE